MKELRASVEEVNKKYNEVVQKIAAYEASSKAIGAGVQTTLNIMENRVNHYASVCNNFEQYSKRECIEVSPRHSCDKGRRLFLSQVQFTAKQ